MVQRLELMLQYLSEQETVDDRYCDIVKKEWKTLVDQANSTIKCDVDLEKINSMAYPGANFIPGSSREED